MNLYHWTQPGLPTDFVRKIISESWDNMTVDEKQVYEKQVSNSQQVIGTYIVNFSVCLLDSFISCKFLKLPSKIEGNSHNMHTQVIKFVIY